MQLQDKEGSQMHFICDPYKCQFPSADLQSLKTKLLREPRAKTSYPKQQSEFMTDCHMNFQVICLMSNYIFCSIPT